jgi:hypothetical protein
MTSCESAVSERAWRRAVPQKIGYANLSLIIA